MKAKKILRITCTFAVSLLFGTSATLLAFSNQIFSPSQIETTSGGDVEENTTVDDTTSFVSVDEIFDSENNAFSYDNMNTLVQYLTGDGSATVSDMSEVDALASSTLSSADILSTVGKDVQVTFGGLTWQVMYLSKDNDGNAILTLWLSNNEQDAWSSRSATEGLYYGYIDGALYSDWSADWYSTSTGSYPSNMYGSSYINAVTLNNGGYYATSTSAVTSASKSANSAFAIFTMTQDELDSAGSSLTSLTDYLVTPSAVSWQETESGPDVGYTYTYSNEAYGTPNTQNWYSSSYNYSGKTYYTSWASNYLWLPSRTETGYSTDYIGLWETSTEQRQNYDGSTTSFTVTAIGSSNSNYGTTAYTYSWLRSANISYYAYSYYLYPSGAHYSNYNVYYSLAVRPALHLNLDSAALSAAADGHQYDSDEEFWYYEDGEFPQSEVSSTTLIKILESSAEMNGEAYVIGSESYAVWECGGGKYIKVTASGKNGTASDSGCTWFVVESIKWVVGYGEEEPSEVTSAVSAKVLTLGSYKTTNSEDLTYRSLFTSTSENSAQAVASGNLTSVVDSVIYDMFNTESVGQDYVYSVNLGNKTDDNTVVTKAGYRVASVSEIDEICGSFQAECSDLVAFLLTCNGTSTSGGDTVDYWTRDLAYYLSESDYYLGYYNSGVYVLADGSVSNCWLTETMGARLSVKIG